MNIKQLKAEFEALSDEDKMSFLKSIFPLVCKGWMNNRESLKLDMMSMCGNMMKEWNMDQFGGVK